MGARTGPAAASGHGDRRRWLLLPWVVAAALGGVALVGPRAPTTPAQAPTPGPVDDAATDDTPIDELPASVIVEVLAAARAAMGTHGLATDAAGADGRWVLDQVVGDVRSTGPGAAQVTVHATVITRSATAWTGPTVTTATVPLQLTPTPRLAGPATVASRAPTDDPTTSTGPGTTPTPPDRVTRPTPDDQETDR